MENPFSIYLNWVRETTGLYWISLILTGILILVLTFIVSIFVCRIAKRLLTHDKVALPATSIYLNIIRIAIWLMGISIFLSTCFSVDVSGIVAALGVGGIAISLGFKDTLANLISGVQVASCKIMKPGDHVLIGTNSGIVEDITWRHTLIKNMYNEIVIVPNSVINSSAIIQKNPFNHVRVHIHLHSKNEGLDKICDKLSSDITEVVKNYGTLKQDVGIMFSSIEDGSAKGTINVVFKDEISGPKAAKIKDAIVKLIAPYLD